MSSRDRFLVIMDPAAIRKEVARAMDQRDRVCLQVIGEQGADEICFRISTTAHTPSSNTLDLILGTTDDGQQIQVTIPATDTPILVIRPNED